MYHHWLAQLTEQDRADIIALIDDAAALETTMAYDAPLSPKAAKALTDSINDALRRGTANLLAFRDLDASARIAAMVALVPCTLPTRSHVIELKWAAIARPHRTTIPPQLLRSAMQRALELGCDRVVLEVRADGQDHLWRSHGFREYGRMHDYARVNGRIISGIYMQATVAQVLAMLAPAPEPTRIAEPVG